MNTALITRTLNFWFKGLVQPGAGGNNAQLHIPKECMQLWFAGGPQVDEQMTAEFGPTVEQLLAQNIQEIQESELLKSAEGALTAILHLDQFTRNIYRGSAQAFAGDEKALQLTRTLIAKQWDVELHPVQRAFVYMPLEHSESAEDQAESVRVFRALRDAYRDHALYGQLLAAFCRYAEEHADIVKQFGRYPHRNRVMGRASTAEEVEYMEAGGQSFGQK